MSEMAATGVLQLYPEVREGEKSLQARFGVNATY